MPIHKVTVESAGQMGSQKESLSPDEVDFVLDCYGMEDIIGTFCWDQDKWEQNHCQKRRHWRVIPNNVNHVDGSDRWFHVRCESRGGYVGSHSLMDFKTSVGLC